MEVKIKLKDILLRVGVKLNFKIIVLKKLGLLLFFIVESIFRFGLELIILWLVERLVLVRLKFLLGFVIGLMWLFDKIMLLLKFNEVCLLENVLVWFIFFWSLMLNILKYCLFFRKIFWMSCLVFKLMVVEMVLDWLKRKLELL